MVRVRLLVSLSMLVAVAACTEFDAPGPAAPTELDLQLARCELDEGACAMRADRLAARGGGQADEDSAARQPIRRISQSGYDYGECDGMILAVLLFPEPCDQSWRAEPIPLREAHY